MHTLVIYDITDDKIRGRVAAICKASGLTRIQKSAFLGKLNSQQRKNLKNKLKRTLGKNRGNIQIFIICNADMKLREIIGEVITYEDEEIIVL